MPAGPDPGGQQRQGEDPIASFEKLKEERVWG